MAKRGNALLLSARDMYSERMDFEAFLAKLNAKDRLNVERHLTACAEVGPQHADLWKRLVTALATLAGPAVQTIGQQAVQFFVADGKYRKQMLALEDARDGKIAIYSPDALAEGLKAGAIAIPAKTSENPAAHRIPGTEQELSVESLTAANTPNPSPWYKHMLGWNRKALRITLPTDATPEQITAAEDLCAIAFRAAAPAAV